MSGSPSQKLLKMLYCPHISMTEQFYNKLPSLATDISSLLQQKDLFTQIPPDWDIIVTDIAGSTKATEDGKYREVNLVAASSIVTALNIAKTHNIAIPFVFGGDGATLATPRSLTAEICRHIAAVARNAQSNFNLTLRVGSVPAKVLYEQGEDIWIAKSMITRGYDQAVFLGNGLTAAEILVKKNPEYTFEDAHIDHEPNLTGLECRWQEIPPRQSHEEIVCLLIAPVNQDPQIFCEVLQTIQSIYGDSSARHPITPEHLRLMKSFRELERETNIKNADPDNWYTLRRVIGVFFASILFKYNLTVGKFNARLYKTQTIAATDTLKIDGAIKTVIAGTRVQRETLLTALHELEDNKKILFGHYVTDSTVMTCYVSDHETGHIHFVDGRGGGYTQASKELKPKLKKSS